VTARAAEDPVAAAVRALAPRLGPLRPRAALVLGSGLGALADEVADAVRIPAGEIPGFGVPAVAGHRGDLVAGTLGGVPVIVQSGRTHLYEGHEPAAVVLPVRVFARLGARTLLVTNAAGAIRPTLDPGALMLIADHINLMWRSPLVGPVRDGEPRFPDMSAPYDAGLRRRAREAARAAGIAPEEGVYAGVLGPSYETRAEIRMLERLGADAVGMSTVPEVIAARAAGLACLGVSVIANVAAGGAAHGLTHDDVLDAGGRAATQLGALVREVARSL
jgi:purine-nucleoside phosphorylase